MYDFDQNDDGLQGDNIVKNDNGKIVVDKRIDFADENLGTGRPRPSRR